MDAVFDEKMVDELLLELEIPLKAVEFEAPVCNCRHCVFVAQENGNTVYDVFKRTEKSTCGKVKK